MRNVQKRAREDADDKIEPPEMRTKYVASLLAQVNNLIRTRATGLKPRPVGQTLFRPEGTCQVCAACGQYKL